MWCIGAPISDIEIKMKQGSAFVSSLRLIDENNRLIDSITYDSNINPSQIIKEKFTSVNVARIELDLRQNYNSAFNLLVRMGRRVALPAR